jgi:hypothetical protein
MFRNSQSIIPFFEKHSIVGVKHLDFLDFCKVASLMQEGSHLTNEVLDLIKQIKASMNRGRKI